MSLARTISVTYNPINGRNTFTSGDFITGQVILDVAKKTQMHTLSVKIKGKAEVFWTEYHNKMTSVYSDEENYYSVERFFVRQDKTHGNEILIDPSGQPYSSVVAPGRHVYPFTFQLPLQHFPPTFKSRTGKIVYTVETKLSRSMCFSMKDIKEFHYIPKPDQMSSSELTAPQYGTINKKMGIFTSGSVSMNIMTGKVGYYHGEDLNILAEFQNSSSRAVKPKYCLYEKHSFFARGKRKLHTHELFKEAGEPIEPNAKKTVTKMLSIPPSLAISILNCKVLKVEYKLRVYLDVPYSLDPEIVFPVVVLPPQSVSGANQTPGTNMHSNPPQMEQQVPPLNITPSELFGASGYCRPNMNPAPGYPGPVGQFAPPSYPGPPGQVAPPSYLGLPGQVSPPSYPGSPRQFAPPSYTGPLGPFSPSVSHQSDPSAPPPYHEYQLYPQLPDHPENDS